MGSYATISVSGPTVVQAVADTHLSEEVVMRSVSILIALGAVVLMTGCSTTLTASDFSGLTTPDGDAKHLNTTNIAVHVLGAGPVWGDATLGATVADHTSAAKNTGARKVRIVQSNVSTYWWLLPPITFIIRPVVTTVAGDAL
jgi:hypothetical protein